jgi:hypothetical protein
MTSIMDQRKYVFGSQFEQENRRSTICIYSRCFKILDVIVFRIKTNLTYSHVKNSGPEGVRTIDYVYMLHKPHVWAHAGRMLICASNERIGSHSEHARADARTTTY